MPVNVARSLIGDLADEGLLLIHRPDTRPDLALLERVLRGPRAI